MSKRHNAKYKIDRRMGENIWGRPKSPVNKRSYKPGQPVSYTHLDVYKRQKFLIFIILTLSANEAFAQCRVGSGPDMGDGIPYCLDIAPQATQSYSPCLLYTSRCV